EVSCGPAMRRSRMPVRVRIHSSLVSRVFSNSSLDSTRTGRQLPVPRRATPIDGLTCHLELIAPERRSEEDVWNRAFRVPDTFFGSSTSCPDHPLASCHLAGHRLTLCNAPAPR